VFRSGGSLKALQKTFYKTIVSKSVFKKIDQKSKADVFCVCRLSICLLRFWTFLGEGSSKTLKKLSKKQIRPWSFFGLCQRPLLLLFVRFSTSGVKKHQKKRFAKKR
jgi:hypothetical protein